MGLLSKIAIAGIVGVGLKKIDKKAKENRAAIEQENAKRVSEYHKRVGSKCRFEDGITEEEFHVIVKRSCKHIKRLVNYSVKGPIVTGNVRSQSGATIWKFRIDFNDYGHLTGKYWLSSDNADSDIPYVIAESIKQLIQNYPEYVDEQFYQQLKIEQIEEQEKILSNMICPYCGKSATAINAKYCSFCGKRFFA